MATKVPSKPGTLGHNGRVWKWTGVGSADNDVCSPIAIQGAKDVTIFAEGTWGGGGVTIHASPMIDKTPADATYVVCKDLADNVVALTVDSHSTVAQLGEYYKPVLTAGTVSSVDIYVLARY